MQLVFVHTDMVVVIELVMVFMCESKRLTCGVTAENPKLVWLVDDIT